MRIECFRSLVLVFFFSTGAQAQEAADSICSTHGCCCNGTDLTPAGVMISHVHPKNEWMISYRYMDMRMSGVLEGNSALNESEVLKAYTASPTSMQMKMHMLMAMYGISDKLTLMAMLNYNSNYMEMTMPLGKSLHHHSMSSSGLGDTRLYGLYALVKKPTEQFILSMGVNLPTGSIQAKGQPGAMMYPGTRLPYAMQLGSGTYDVLPCLSYLHQKQKLTYSAQVAAIIHTHKNSLGYKLGDELALNAWLGWQWLKFFSSTLRLEAIATTTISGTDATLDQMMEPAATSTNYGGKRATAYLGMAFQPTKSFLRAYRLSIEYGLPFYQNTNGVQMNTNSFVNIALSTSF